MPRRRPSPSPRRRGARADASFLPMPRMGRGTTQSVVEGSMALTDRTARRNAAVSRARMLRRTPSLSEGLLWQILRMRPGGFKFRRQHPFERCTVDFYCAAAKLVVEIDGDAHSMGHRPTND